MRESLIKARIAAGYTQTSFAEKVGIERTSYVKIETGQTKRVDVVDACNISKELGKKVEEIFLPYDVLKTNKKKTA